MEEVRVVPGAGETIGGGKLLVVVVEPLEEDPPEEEPPEEEPPDEEFPPTFMKKVLLLTNQPKLLRVQKAT